jgi:N-acyl homoserine lactone hydrolase
VNAPASITITPVRVADLLAGDERMPVYVHVIDHPDARVLVDTGMTELHPAVADMDPRLRPLSEQDFDLDGIDLVVNTHLHFDHCGGNHLFTGKPIYVQRRELDDARSEDDYTIREWVDARAVATPHRLGHHAGGGATVEQPLQSRDAAVLPSRLPRPPAG